MSRRAAAGLAVAVVLGGSAVLDGCARRATYVWADKYDAPAPPPEPYRLQPGDKLNLLVWNQAQLSGPVIVRVDGSAGIPLLGDIALAGLTPAEASAELARRLDGIIVDPRVTVTVAEMRASTVTVIGEVRQPGVIALQPGDGVLQVLARAGGVTAYASHDGVYVLRPKGVRVRFDLERLTRDGGAAARFRLAPGDVVVVE